MKFLFRLVQRMRSILAILALFVCTSICLGVEKEIPPPPVMGAWYVGINGYNCAVNVDAVFVIDKNDLFGGMNAWRTPVDCILNITKDESQNAHIGAYACGARMCRTDKDFNENVLVPDRRMTGNGINVRTGVFSNSTLSGAYSKDISAAVDTNRVTITNIQGGNIGWVYGGRAVDTSASNNTVTISGVDIGNNNIENDKTFRSIDENKGMGVVYGGYVHDNGVAMYNRVNIRKNVRDVSVRGTVYGGYVGENGTVTINTVNLTSVTVTNDICGAWVKNGYANDNAVTINGGTVIGNVCGGFVTNGTVTISTVNLNSVTVARNVYGAWIRNGLARDNKVKIEGGKIEGDVYGGHIDQKGTATLNKVNLTSVTVSSNVYGAWIRNGLAEDNKVEIDGKGNRNIGGAVYGGYIEEKGTATLNKVNLTSVTVSSNVYGARIGNGLARDNKVEIDGKGNRNIGGAVYGGYIEEKGTATLNKVHLTRLA